MDFKTILLIIGILPGVIFLWSLVDILRSEFTNNNKIIWLLVVIFLNIFGAILYLLFGRKQKVNNSGGGTSLLITILSIIIFIVLIVGLIVFVLADSSSSNQSNSLSPDRTNELIEEGQSFEQSTTQKEKIGILYPLDVFTVNLKGNAGRRYLKTVISLEFKDESLKLELDNKKPIIRDRIVSILSSKTLEEISSKRGKERISLQIIDSLNSMFTNGRIKNLYFSEFTIQ